jgi:hypothetical protein
MAKSFYLENVQSALEGATKHHLDTMMTAGDISNSLPEMESQRAFGAWSSVQGHFDRAQHHLDVAWDSLSSGQRGGGHPENSEERQNFEVMRGKEVAQNYERHVVEFHQAADGLGRVLGEDHPLALHLKKEAMEKDAGWLNTIESATYSKDNPDFFGIMQRNDLNPKQFGFEE